MTWVKDRKEVPLTELRPVVAGYPDYSRLVDPEPLRSLACHIVDPHRDRRGWNIAQAAALFDYVKRNVVYDYWKRDDIQHREPTTIYRPSYTLELGRGICGDQAVLVASLFAAVFIPCTLVVADTLLGPHLLTALPVGKLVATQLADAVRCARGRIAQPIQPWIFHDVGNPATFADTAAGEYLGDYPSQVRLGTVVESGGIGSWRRIIATFPVHA
jgi:transglutaminase-like putative cysteine protease